MAKSTAEQIKDVKAKIGSSTKETTTSPETSKPPVSTEASESESAELLECAIVRAILDEIDGRNDIGDSMRMMPLHTKLEMVKIMRQSVRDLLDGAS